ncbi:MAG: bifunctional UDP-sugar hydrolase/5'-nucleotidase [Bacteroidetes bacterium]|nr:bifunctional UDP-sugar hydrolase/5'-nucleotidase [Bacteroidota bacterium]
MVKKIVFLVAGLAFLLSVSSAEGKKSSGKTTKVIILHVNDMHAKIDNLPKLAWLADSLRKTNPYVFLLSAGDNFTGNPVVDMIADKGFPMIDLMNRCKFDASAIGNHEFDLGQVNLEKRFEQAGFPFICCNLDFSATSLKQPQPYIVLDAGKKIHIAILGIIELNDKGIPDTHPTKVEGIKFYDGIGEARKYAWLKKKYGILIGLTHLGVETDVRLADTLPELDEIIGGHSHTLIEKPMMQNGVMIVQAGANLKYIGKTTLEVKKGHVTARSDEVIPITALRNADPDMVELCKRYNVNEEFNQVAGIAGSALNGYDALGSLMTDALVSELKVDFAFQNRGGIRISSLPAGPITVKDIYQLDPFGNQVVTYRMNQKEIVSLITYAFTLEKAPDLQVSGMTYTLLTDGKGRCLGVEILDTSGKPLDPVKDYSVAMNSYIAASYRFDHRDAGNTAAITTAEVLISYLKKAGTVNYSGVKRIGQKIQTE